MSVPRIVMATGNAGKVREIIKMFEDLPVEWVSQKDLGNPPEVIEDGTTFRENALKKARGISDWANLPAMAEDSGLQVDALDGAPGVYSARFAGENATDADNTRLLLEKLADVPEEKRTARFRAYSIISFRDGTTLEAEGVCEGRIAFEPAGDAGFGYDPVFIPAGEEKSFAQLGLDIKNGMSHRAKALENLRPLLVEYLNE